MRKMTGHRCCVCGDTKARDGSVNSDRIPADMEKGR